LDSSLWKLAMSQLQGQRLTFLCHPDRLQLYADEVKLVVGLTNEHRRDMLKAGDQLAARRKEFEALIDSALAGLEL